MSIIRVIEPVLEKAARRLIDWVDVFALLYLAGWLLLILAYT